MSYEDTDAEKLDHMLSEIDELNSYIKDIPNVITKTESILTVLKNLQSDFAGIKNSRSKKSSAENDKLLADISMQLSANQEMLLGKISDVEKKVETISSIQKNLDEISEIVEKKSVYFKQDFPEVKNPNEETLKKLTDYGEEILSQLSLAARWYARKLPELRAHETAIKNLDEVYKKEIKSARESGIVDGRKSVIKDLFKIYDIKILMSATDNPSKALADFLKNAGVQSRYEVGDKFEITEEDLNQHQSYIDKITTGKIEIISPAYIFDGNIIARATFKPVDESNAEQEG